MTTLETSLVALQGPARRWPSSSRSRRGPGRAAYLRDRRGRVAGVRGPRGPHRLHRRGRLRAVHRLGRWAAPGMPCSRPAPRTGLRPCGLGRSATPSGWRRACRSMAMSSTAPRVPWRPAWPLRPPRPESDAPEAASSWAVRRWRPLPAPAVAPARGPRPRGSRHRSSRSPGEPAGRWCAIGAVTSGSQSPTLERAIAMAYVPPSQSAPGTMLEVAVRDRPSPPGSYLCRSIDDRADNVRLPVPQEAGPHRR